MFRTLKKLSSVSGVGGLCFLLLMCLNFLWIDTKAVWMWDTPKGHSWPWSLKELFSDPWVSLVKVQGSSWGAPFCVWSSFDLSCRDNLQAQQTTVISSVVGCGWLITEASARAYECVLYPPITCMCISWHCSLPLHAHLLMPHKESLCELEKGPPSARMG